MTILISVIIPTYNRSAQLTKCLLALKQNFLSFRYFEIIICDSNSKDNTNIKIKKLQKELYYLNIRYFNVNKNLNSLKRNKGLKESRGKYKIFLDDDCVPEKNFIKKYYSILNKTYTKSIYCGSVDYKEDKNLKNFLRYRRSRHFNLNKKNFSCTCIKSLTPATIVTMNMGFDSRIEKFIIPVFDERFNLYGFEDFEFGYRLKKNNIKIIAANPLIYHSDSRSFKLYLSKLKFLGEISMKYLEKINLDSAKSNNFYKLQSNVLIKFLLKFTIFYKLLKLIENFLLFLEKYFFYFSPIYKISFMVAYLQGCHIRQRDKIGYFESNIWYK